MRTDKQRFHRVIHRVTRQVLFVTGAAALSAMVASASTAKTGENRFEVMVKGADGKPVTNADVMVLLVMPAMPAKKMPETRDE